MAAHWLLCNVGSPDRISELAYAITECGRTAEILSIKDTYEMSEIMDETFSQTIFRGSLNLSCALRETRPNWSGLLHSRSQYLCSRYYPVWGEHLVQDQHFFISHGELLRRWDTVFASFSVDGKLFIRPDSGEKEFDGAVVHQKNKDVWTSECSWRNVSPSEMCVISLPVKIESETRLIVANGRVLTGSLYRESTVVMHIPAEDDPSYSEMVSYAEERLKELSFPKIHCLDIAVVDGQHKILEVGCFCCCGIYRSDIKKVAKGISEAIEDER